MKISDLEAKLTREAPTPVRQMPRFTLPTRDPDWLKASARHAVWEAERRAAPIATRDAVWKLRDATEELIESNERSSQLLIRLTMALVALTIAIVGLTGLLVVLAL